MSETGLKIIDTTIQETNRWLKIVMDELETDDKRLAFGVLRAGLHALRDRVGPQAAVHLGAQLPMLLRGAYYEGWKPVETPAAERHAQAFLAHMKSSLPPGLEVEPAEAFLAASAALAEQLDPGEWNKLQRQVPSEIGAMMAEASLS